MGEDCTRLSVADGGALDLQPEPRTWAWKSSCCVYISMNRSSRIIKTAIDADFLPTSPIMSANNNTHQAVEQKLSSQAEHHEHATIHHDAFNRRHSTTSERRGSIDLMKKNFDSANIEMCLPVKGHLEMIDDGAKDNSISSIAVS